MTPQELEEGYLWAYKTVYSWENVLRRILVVPALRWPYLGFVLGYKKFAPLTNWLSQFGLFNGLFNAGIKLLLPRRRPQASTHLQTAHVGVNAASVVESL